MNAFFNKIKGFFAGKDAHAKNSVRYLLIVLAFFMFLFFSNDFDLINVQKTAIVMAIGIDKDGEDFSLTSQIAVPSASGAQGESGAKTVNVVTKGKTVAQALDKVNEKTGWYPKLVFCRLILLGESTTKENTLDALEYFLRDEYIADSCLVAACEGKAQELLGNQTPIDSASALAIEKVLSSHAQRVGTSLPNTLRLFVASYFGEAKSGFLPLVKAKPLGEEKKGESEGKAQQSGQSQGQGQSSQSQGGGQTKSQGGQEEKVFSAGETALFVDGKMVGKLNEKQSFSFALIKNQLRLAAYTLPYEGNIYTLTIKRSSPSFTLTMSPNPHLEVQIKTTLGLVDVSKAQPIEDTSDVGDFPKPLLSVASQKIEEDVLQLFERCRALGFDAFDAIDKLQKYQNEHFDDKKDTLLSELNLSVRVQAESVR